MRREQLHKINRIATWLIAGMAVANVAWLIAAKSTWDEIVFRGLQYVAMLLTPFSVKGYSIETKDLSALASNTQHAEMRDFLAHKGHDYSRQMLILNFHCNLDFGTQRRDSGKRINNEDKENGILSGTK